MKETFGAVSKDTADRVRSFLEQREKEILDKASKVSAGEYKGWVSWEEHGPMDGYFESVDALREWCEEEGLDVPEMVFGCRKEKLSLDAEQIIDDALAEHHDYAKDYLADGAQEELQSLLDAWCAKQSVFSWIEDRDVVVVIDGKADAQA